MQARFAARCRPRPRWLGHAGRCLQGSPTKTSRAHSTPLLRRIFAQITPLQDRPRSGTVFSGILSLDQLPTHCRFRSRQYANSQAT